MRFVYEPGWIRDSLRFMTHSIEALADQVLEPWGARLQRPSRKHRQKTKRLRFGQLADGGAGGRPN
jgi:hypothetical protein